MAKALPSAANVSKFLSVSEGRDKLLRLGQYGGRFLAFYLTSGGKPSDFAKKCSIVESQFSDGRKMIRLFKWIQHYNKIAADKTPLPTKIISSGKEFFLMLFMFYDNKVWMSKKGLIANNTAAYLQRAARFWLCAILISLCTDTIKMMSILENEKINSKRVKQWATKLQEGPDPEAEKQWKTARERLSSLRKEKATLHLTFVKNIADLPIAFSNGGFLANKLSNGVTGFLGTISSLVGIHQVWLSSTKK